VRKKWHSFTRYLPFKEEELMDRSLFLYLTTAVALTTPVFLLIPTDPSPSITLILFFLSSFAPMMAAILALFFSKNSNSVHTFLRRLSLWRLERFWYAMALMVPTGVWLIAMAHFVFDGVLQATIPIRMIFFPVVLITAYGSEAGWRGFLLPRLLAFLDPIPSSLLLGVLWSAFYLPFFWQNPQILILLFALGPVLSIISTWLFLGTGESVPLTALFQATFITCGMVLSPVSHSALVLATALAGLWVLFLVLRCGGCLLNNQVDNQISIDAQSFPKQRSEEAELFNSNGFALYGQLAVKPTVNQPVKNS
jgi:uncharacterized protein